MRADRRGPVARVSSAVNRSDLGAGQSSTGALWAQSAARANNPTASPALR